MKDEASSAAEKNVYTQISDFVEIGNTLSKSMEKIQLFSKYEYYTIKIGEETGQLAVVLKELSDHFNEKIKIRRLISRALSYPLIVLMMAGSIFYFMLQVVIPIFSDFFSQHDKELPSFTQNVIKLSEYSDDVAIIFVIVILVLGLSYSMLKDNVKYRYIVNSIVIRIPFVGRMVKEVYLAQFCQSMSFLTRSNVGIIDALELVSNSITFYPLQAAITEVKADVISGHTLNEALLKHKIFGNRIPSLIKFGEHTNKLGILFSELGKQYSEKIEHKTKLVSTIIEPVLIIFVAVAVGIIMMAIYLPMSEMSSVVE